MTCYRRRARQQAYALNCAVHFGQPGPRYWLRCLGALAVIVVVILAAAGRMR